MLIVNIEASVKRKNNTDKCGSYFSDSKLFKTNYGELHPIEQWEYNELKSLGVKEFCKYEVEDLILIKKQIEKIEKNMIKKLQIAVEKEKFNI